MSQNITVELQSNGTTIVEEPKTISIAKNICNENLQHQEQSIQVSFNYSQQLFSLMAIGEEITAVVKDGTTVIFTGIVNEDVSWTDEGNPYPVHDIQMTIRDFTQKFDVTTEEEVGLIDTTLSAVVNQICGDCGVTVASSQIIPSAVEVEAFVLDKGSNYKTALDNILFQYGYSYFFNASGQFVYFNFNDIPDQMETLSEEEILNKPKFSRLNKNYNAVKLSYNKLTKRENELVYYEASGYDSNESVIPAVVQPGVYFPFNSAPEIEATDGQVYQDFQSGYAQTRKKYNGELEYQRSQKTTLLYTENHSIVEDWEGGSINVNRQQFGYRHASIRLQNIGNTDADVYSLSIRADAYYRDVEASVVVGEGKKYYTCQAEHIFNNSAAETLALILYRYFCGVKYKIQLSSEEEIVPGTYKVIDTGLSGFIISALAISSTYNPETELYSVTFISIGPAQVVQRDLKDQISSSQYNVKGQKGQDGQNAIVMTSATTPTGSYIGQLGLYQSQIYKWDGSIWINTSAVLPTDPILHYSFDEVPDLPDGTATYKKDNDFTTLESSWSPNNFGTLSIVNGKLRNTANQNSSWFRKYFNNVITNQIVKVKVTCSVSKTLYLQYYDGSGYVVINRVNAEANKEYTLSGFIPSTNFVLVSAQGGTGTANYVTDLSTIYIGNGSYNTPIIDNAGGKYNATNNGGLAIEGISWKGVKIIGTENYIDVVKESLSGAVTISLWANNNGQTAKAMHILDGRMTGYTNARYQLFYVTETGKIEWNNGTSTSTSTKQFFLFDSEWHNYTLVSDGATYEKLYRDGVIIEESRDDQHLLMSERLRLLNRYQITTTAATGVSLDDFQVFNRALSEEEILGLYLSKGNTPKYYSISDYQLESIDDDGVISPIEKQNLFSTWKQIYNAVNVSASLPTTSPVANGGEYKGVIDEANSLNIINTTKITAYIQSANELRSALWNVTNGYLLNMQSQSTVRTDINLDTILANYRTALQDARTAIGQQQSAIASALGVSNSNPFCLIPVNATTGNPNYENTGTTLQLFNGTTELTPIISGTLADNQWKVTASGTHISQSINGTIPTGTKQIVYGNVSAFAANETNATVTYTIQARINGVTNTIYTTQKFAKAQEGADGRIYDLRTENGTIVKSPTGNLTPSTVTVKAYSWTASNSPALFASGDLKAFENGVQRGSTVSQGSSITVTPSGNYPIVVQLLKHGTNTILDEMNIPVLTEVKGDKGDTGASVGNQILRGTNTTFTELVPSSSSTWANKKWRKASTTTDNRTVIDITDCPDPNIVKGVNILGGNTSADHISQDAIPLLSGVEYTMSCWAKADSLTHTPKLNCQWWKDSSHSGSTNINLSTEWKKYSFTFAPNVDTPNIYFGGRYASTDTTTNIKICGMKVELGNTATDWCEYEYDKNGKKIKISDYTLRTWSASQWTQYSTEGNTASWTNTDHDFAVGDILIVPAKLSSEGNIIGQSYNEVTGTPYQDGSYWRIPCKVLYGVKGEKGQTGATGAKGDKGDTGATGAKGDKGDRGATGARGATWYQGNKITGWNTTGTVFSSSGITSAIVGDQYLNTDTQDIYTCTLAGNASTAKWAYVGNLTKDESTDTLRFDAWKGTNTVYKGTAITGTSTTATIFSGSGITNALVDDLYINTSTDNVYKCTVGGSASVAKWVFTSLAYANTIDDGPFGKQTIMKTYRRTGNTTQYGSARSVNYSKTPIDVNKRYRFSIFWKPVVTVSGVNNYFGVGPQNNTNYVASLGSSSGSTNAYMFSGSGTSLNPNRWYLIVASVHPSAYTSTVMDSETGVYDALTGEKVASATDFKWMPNCPSVYTRQLFNYIGDTTGRKAEHWFTMPRMDLCNGLQPSLADLLKGNSHTTEWYSGSAITGTSTTATVFSSSGITYAVKGDKYINTDSASASYNNVYECVKGGIPSIATWKYTQNIKGDKGDRGFSSRTIAFRVNHDTFGNVNDGEVYVCGYNSSGAEADVAGYVIVDGTTYYAKGMINTNASCDGYIVIPISATGTSGTRPQVAYLSNIGTNKWDVFNLDQTSSITTNITDANLGNWIVIGKQYQNTAEGKVQVEPVTPCKLSSITQPFDYHFEGIVATTTDGTASITPYKITQNSSTSYSVSTLASKYVRRGAVVLNIENLSASGTPDKATIRFFNGSYWNQISDSDVRYRDMITLLAGILPLVAGFFVYKNKPVPPVCGTYIETLTANMAIINELFANKIKINEGGAIYGGNRYNADGTIKENGTNTGLYISDSGELKGFLRSAINDCVLIGDGAGSSIVHNTATVSTEFIDRGNVFIGTNAGNYIVRHGYNQNNWCVGIGGGACGGNVGNNVVSIGQGSCIDNRGSDVVGIGAAVCRVNTGSDVIGIGTWSCRQNIGNYVVGIGYGTCDGNSLDYFIDINSRLIYVEFKTGSLQSRIYLILGNILKHGTYNMACIGRFGTAEEVLYVRVRPTYYEFCNVTRDVVLNISYADVGITADFQCMLIAYANPENQLVNQ